MKRCGRGEKERGQGSVRRAHLAVGCRGRVHLPRLRHRLVQIGEELVDERRQETGLQLCALSSSLGSLAQQVAPVLLHLRVRGQLQLGALSGPWQRSGDGEAHLQASGRERVPEREGDEGQRHAAHDLVLQALEHVDGEDEEEGALVDGEGGG